jgi:hypothetical protein
MDPHELVFMFTVFFLFCVPGIFVGALGWFLTSRMAHKTAQLVFRGLLVALAITPTPAVHGGFIPAVWVFWEYRRLRVWDSYVLQYCLLPLLIVWSLSLPIVYALTRMPGKSKL